LGFVSVWGLLQVRMVGVGDITCSFV
jgi:hypothetical protein